MDNDEIRRVVQSARALLRWDAARFAAGVGVGEVTIRRIEAGVPVKPATVEKVLDGLGAIGVAVIGAGRGCEDARIVIGIGLTRRAEVGPPPLASAHKGAGSRQVAPRRAAASGKVAAGTSAAPQRQARRRQPD